MKTKLSTRFLSLLLCVLMCVSLLPAQAFADAGESANEEAENTVALGEESTEADFSDSAEEPEDGQGDTAPADEPEQPVEETPSAQEPVIETPVPTDDVTPEEPAGETAQPELAEDGTSGTCGDNLTWSFDSTTGTLTISGNGTMTNWSGYSAVPWYSISPDLKAVVIGSDVTSIGNYAFSRIGVERVTIADDAENPSKLATIGNYAFSDSGIAHITLPASLESIGDYAFYECWSLTEFTIPDGVKSIGAYAFKLCYYLTTLTIGKGVASVGTNAFELCSDLTNLTLKNSRIGDYMFIHCSGLTNVTISASVTSIGSHAFYDCSNLVSVTLENTVTGDYMFSDCDALTDVTMNDDIAEIGQYMFSGCKALESITLPDNLTEIGKYAFNGTGLTTVTFPQDNPIVIGTYAFAKCTSLKSVVISDNITSIGTYVFAYCTALSSVTIGKGLKTISGYAFYKCTALTGAVIPNNVTNIGNNAFAGCTALNSVTIPDSVTDIYSYAFSGCTALTEITIPFSVFYIDVYAFGNCSSLTKVTFEGNAPSIGKSVFSNDTLTVYFPTNGLSWTDDAKQQYGGKQVTWEGYVYPGVRAFGTCGDRVACRIGYDGTLTITGIGKMSDWMDPDNVIWKDYISDITNVAIKDGVTSIGDYSFYNFVNLTGVEIGNNVTSIGDYAFYGCSKLRSITIPDGVTQLGASAFEECINLNTVNIPEKVTDIGSKAFYDCCCLAEIRIPASVENIGGGAFAECSTLPEIVVSEDSTYFCAADGVLYDKEYNKLIAYPAGKPVSFFCRIPSSVTRIEEFAFSGNGYLEYLIIPNGVRYVGTEAFSGCGKLTDILFQGENEPDKISGYKAPSFGTDVFAGDELTVDFPDVSSWDKIKGLSYGGESVTWTRYSLFTLGRDNNSFTNSVKEGGGFEDATNYQIDKDYLDKLTSNVDKSVIKKNMNSKNDGCCTGIALSIGALFNGKIGISDLTDASAANYYDLPRPCENDQLRNTIYFYHLSQFLDNGGKWDTSVSTIMIGSFGDNLKKKADGVSCFQFLQALVKAANLGKVYLFGFRTPSTLHAILITGCSYDAAAGQYMVQIYDENTIGSSSTGEFSYMTVEDDFSGFSYTDHKGDTINENNYKYAYIDDFDKMEGYLFEEEASSGHTYLTLTEDSRFTITNAEGKTLSYDGSSFSGDMNIYHMSPVISDSSASYIFETDDSASFTVTGSNVDIDVHNDTDFLSLSGSGFDSATLTLGEGITLKGTDYSFKAYIQTDEISENEAGLISVSANATSDVTIEKQGSTVTAVSEEPMTNVVTTDYVGVEATETQHEDAAGISAIANASAMDGVPVLTQDYMALAAGETVQLQLTDEIKSMTEALTWKSEDESIATVDQNGVVAGKSKGTTRIVCSLGSDTPVTFSQCRIDVTSGSVAEEIENNTAVIKVGLAQTAAAVNIYSTDYTELTVVPVLEQNLGLMDENESTNTNAAVTKAEFAKLKDGSDNPLNKLFELRVKDDRTLVIIPTDEALAEAGKGTLKKSYTSAILVTINGKETPYETAALKLSVTSTLPKLKVSAVKFNAADPCNTQAIKITGANITGLSWNGTETAGLVLDGRAMTIALAAENAPTKGGKLNLLAAVEGYSVSVPVTVSYSIAKTVPSIKLKASSLSVLSGSFDEASTTFTITPTDFTTDKYAVEIQSITDSSTKKTVKNSNGLNVSINGNIVSVTATESITKAKTYTVILNVVDANHTPVGKAAKLTVKVLAASTTAKPAVKLSASASGTMETAIPRCPIKLAAKLSGFHAGSGETWTVVVERVSAKTKTSAERRYDITDRFNIEGENGTYVLTLQNGETLSSGYTYEAKVSVDTDGDGTADATSKSVKLNVKWTATAKLPVTVTLKAKGSIDPLRTGNSSIVLTPTFKNCYDYSITAEDLKFVQTIGKVKNELTAEQSPFDVTVKNGTWVLQEKSVGALAEADASGNAKYTVYFSADIHEKPITSKAVSLTVKAGKTVINQSDKTVSLIKADRNDTAIIRLTVAEGENPIVLDSVTLDSASAKFYELNNLGNGYYEIGFKNQTVDAKAKTTTAKLTVKLQGAPANDKGATVSVKINLISVK